MSADETQSAEIRRILRGTNFACSPHMDLKEATMPCPKCQGDCPTPLSGSTFIIAWYRCNRCGHFWSARIKNGEPVSEDEAMPAVAAGRTS